MVLLVQTLHSIHNHCSSQRPRLPRAPQKQVKTVSAHEMTQMAKLVTWPPILKRLTPCYSKPATKGWWLISSPSSSSSSAAPMTALFLLWGLQWAPEMSWMGSCPSQRWVAAWQGALWWVRKGSGFPVMVPWTSLGVATCWLCGPGPVTPSLSLTFPSMWCAKRPTFQRTAEQGQCEQEPSVHRHRLHRQRLLHSSRSAPSQWTVAGSSLSLSLFCFLQV